MLEYKACTNCQCQNTGHVPAVNVIIQGMYEPLMSEYKVCTICKCQNTWHVQTVNVRIQGM